MYYMFKEILPANVSSLGTEQPICSFKSAIACLMSSIFSPNTSSQME